MPFDTEVISVLEAENLMYQASWIERYLIGKAYNLFARPNVSGDYKMLDETTASYEMGNVVDRLNDELEKLGLNKIGYQSSFKNLIQSLRQNIKTDKRSSFLNWIVGNEDESYWTKFIEREGYKLPTEELKNFCRNLVLESTGELPNW